MLVYYSLGNFVSGQQGASQLLEGMADITFQKDPDTGEVRVEQYSMEPLVMHYEPGFVGYGVYPLEDYTDWRQKAEYRKPRGRNTRWRRSKRILNHI